MIKLCTGSDRDIRANLSKVWAEFFTSYYWRMGTRKYW